MTRDERIRATRAEMAATQAERERADLERHLRLMNVPKHLWDVSLDKIPDKAPHKAKLLRWHDLYLEGLRERAFVPGLFIHGNHGSGKSAIAAGILRWALQFRVYGYFLPAADLVKAALDNPPLNDLVDEGVWDYALRCRLLVLDDLGRGSSANSYSALMWTRAEELLRSRLAADLTTIVTSNGTLEAIGNVTGHDGLPNILAESCYELPVVGLDYRSEIARRRPAL